MVAPENGDGGFRGDACDLPAFIAVQHQVAHNQDPRCADGVEELRGIGHRLPLGRSEGLGGLRNQGPGTFSGFRIIQGVSQNGFEIAQFGPAIIVLTFIFVGIEGL